ncbi:hypothetical protein [Sphingomonas sp. PB4P5]|uniref:hypothetical protein n=1 Tax=Parasphingomonas puruogangriensis TaxID=3096155 RepID=UPI002FCA371B
MDRVTREISAFLDRIGIPVVLEAIPGDTFLPAMAIRNGALIVDLARLTHPGDLLHEAGHIAVTDPALRPTLSEVSSDGGEEMAAIAWSYAAALAIGIDPRIVFHDHGYAGGGAHLAEQFAAGHYLAVPLLQWFGMARDATTAAADGVAAFPQMIRWLR